MSVTSRDEHRRFRSACGGIGKASLTVSLDDRNWPESGRCASRTLHERRHDCRLGNETAARLACSDNQSLRLCGPLLFHLSPSPRAECAVKKFALLTVVCLGLGFWLQRTQRPSAADLELQATIAWNERNLEAAERTARLALGRDRHAVRAREVLSRIAVVLQRPALQLALVLDEQKMSQTSERSLTEAGRIALAANWFRVADDEFTEGVHRFPESAPLQRQHTALSGLRLDAEEMEARLTRWSEHGRPTTDLVVMSLGLWSLETRGAAPAETWLKAALEADANDLDSRLGLARTYLAMGRYRECIHLLAAQRNDARAGLLLARAYATTKDIPAATKLLPAVEPAVLRGDYWFTKGLIAVEQGDLTSAEVAFGNAVQARPLDQSFRSRYCAVLRRLNQAERLERQLRELDTVVQIAQQSKLPGLAVQVEALRALSTLCRRVGATATAELLSRSLDRS